MTMCYNASRKDETGECIGGYAPVQIGLAGDFCIAGGFTAPKGEQGGGGLDTVLGCVKLYVEPNKEVDMKEQKKRTRF